MTTERKSTRPKTRTRPKRYGVLQPAVAAVARPLFRFFWDITVEGIDHVPAGGPAILCPNHVSVFDSFVLPAILPRPIVYVGKAEYLDDWKTAKLFPALGMIPIDRRGGEHAEDALSASRAVLDGGGLFGIYPEGTRSRSGKLHRGHTGAARLAVETGAPIIPIGIVGTREIQPPDRAMPRVFRRATLRIGEPISVERYRHRVGDRAVFRELTDEVMFEIQYLCGQEYEDTYAGSTPSIPEPERVPTIPRRSSASVLTPRPLVDVG